MATQVFNEPNRKGEFLVSEANGAQSREVANVKSGVVLKDGDVVAFNAGELIHYVSGAAAGVAYGDADGSVEVPTEGAPVQCVYIARQAEVRGTGIRVVEGDTEGEVLAAAITALKALLIEVR